MLWYWATQRICWTDTAIDGTTNPDIPKGLPKLQVFALRSKLASEVQTGMSRADVDGNPETHNEDSGTVMFAQGKW